MKAIAMSIAAFIVKKCPWSQTGESECIVFICDGLASSMFAHYTGVTLIGIQVDLTISKSRS